MILIHLKKCNRIHKKEENSKYYEYCGHHYDISIPKDDEKFKRQPLTKLFFEIFASVATQIQ